MSAQDLGDVRRLCDQELTLDRCAGSIPGIGGIVAAELVWAGPLSYFARTVHATIGRAFWPYSKDLAASGQSPDWRDRIGLI